MKKSGLSQMQFALQHELKLSTFTYWIRNTPGWRPGVMSRSRFAEGWKFSELNSRGNNFTGRTIQNHPGTHRHFSGKPYWKVSGSSLNSGVPVRIRAR